MEELKSEQNSPEEIGFGPQFGCFQPTPNMDHGPHQERSISWNPEVMMRPTQQEETTNLHPLFIGDLTGHKINTL